MDDADCVCATEYLPPQPGDDDQLQSQNAYVAVRFEEMLIETVSPSVLNVDWCPVLNCDNLHGYKLRYAIKDSNSYNEVFLSPATSSYTLSGLKAATEYVILVCAIDNKEQVIQICGEGTQRTDDYEDKFNMCRITTGRLSRSTPYLAIIAAGLLLTTAIVVPLTILLTAYDSLNQNESPNLTAVVGITLLLVAVVVPLTFFFLRKCEPCSSPNDTRISILNQKVETQDFGSPNVDTYEFVTNKTEITNINM